MHCIAEATHRILSEEVIEYLAVRDICRNVDKEDAYVERHRVIHVTA